MNLVALKKSKYSNSAGPGIPMLSINGKNGVIAFNKPAISQFDLSPGQNIEILKDEQEDPPEYYFKPKAESDNDTFHLQKGAGRVSFSSKTLAREMIQNLQKKQNPNKQKSELNVQVLVRFKLATKEAMDGDKLLKGVYAILGGTVVV